MYASSHYQSAPPLLVSPSFHSSGYSRLESMAHADYEHQPTIAYSIRSFPHTPVYGPSMVSFPSSFSSSTDFQYSSDAEQTRYHTHSSQTYSLIVPSHTEYHFQPSEFLKPGKEGKFIGKAEEIKEYIVDTFQKIFHTSFPSNIIINICNEQEFRKIAPHPGTIGLSINRGKEGLISEIFVLNDTLARVMLTLGHELGHVVTSTLDNPHDEEAKAYAFSFVWMRAIKEHDIAGLADALVTERPAENGLHNVAFRWVERLLHAGKEVGEIYDGLIKKVISLSTPFY